MAGAQGAGSGRRGCSPRSRLWGLGFAALGALGRELEPGTELRSQRSHRDERRSRRLGFSRRPAPSVRPPDRWASAAAAGPRPPPLPVPRRAPTRWGCFGERWPPAPSARALQPPERFEATLELSCVQPRSPARGTASHLVVGVLSWGLPGTRAARGRLGVSEVQAEGAGCVLVWGCFCALGARAQRRAVGGSHPALSPPCEARPLLPFVKS